jgi:hypothetical protein
MWLEEEDGFEDEEDCLHKSFLKEYNVKVDDIVSLLKIRWLDDCNGFFIKVEMEGFDRSYDISFDIDNEKISEWEVDCIEW